MRESLQEYITALGRWGWAVLMGILVGGAGAYLDISGAWGFPTWLWLTMLGVAAIIVPFIAFHRVRVQRDAALGAEQSLVLTPRTYAIGLSGMTGYPNKPDGAYWLRLEASVNATYNKPIDTLDLLIGDATIHANSWPGRKTAAFTVYFNVTDWKWKGEIQVELQARIQGAVHSSGRINIDFNADPGGFPRYL